MNITNKILLSKPVKKLPQRIVYKYYKPNEGYNYRMFSIKTKEVIGNMRAFPEFVTNSKYYPDMQGYFSYHIANLVSKLKPKQRVGTQLINLAKIESLRDKKCQGRINLIATTLKSDSPIFYAKQGFKSQHPSFKNIQLYTEGKKNFIPLMHMYLPIEKISKTI